MPFDFFSRKKKKGEEPAPSSPPPDPDSADERTHEEEAIAERARAEAARRAEERRGDATEVADFLGDMLEASAPRKEEEAQPPQEESPSVGLVLGGESSGPAPEAGGAAPFAPETDEIPAPFVAFDAGEPPAPPPPPAFAPEPEPEAARLSPPLQAVLEEFRSLGRSASDPRLSFEAELSSDETDRTIALLVKERRAHPVALAFEPEEAADAEADTEATRKTAILEPVPPRASEPGATTAHHHTETPSPVEEEAPPLSREYSLDDLPGSASPGDAPAEEPAAPEGEDRLAEGELADAGLLDAAGEEPPIPPPEPEYGLDDLPEAEDENADAGPEEEPVASEPAMEDANLQAGLDEALAAADAADAGPEPVAAPDEPAPAPAPAPRDYSLDDLPEAPTGPADEELSDERTAPDDQMPDQSLPSLAPPSQDSTEPASPGGMTALERAVDGSVEPSTEAGAASGPMSEAQLPPAPPPPEEDVAGSERAADLSARQLAAVERLLEREVEPAEALAAPVRERTVERLGLAVRTLRATTGWLAGKARGTRKATDRRLAPYSLSCRKLLGIASLLVLAAIATLSFKIWVLPWFAGGSG